MVPIRKISSTTLEPKVVDLIQNDFQKEETCCSEKQPMAKFNIKENDKFCLLQVFIENNVEHKFPALKLLVHEFNHEFETLRFELAKFGDQTIEETKLLFEHGFISKTIFHNIYSKWNLDADFGDIICDLRMARMIYPCLNPRKTVQILKGTDIWYFVPYLVEIVSLTPGLEIVKHSNAELRITYRIGTKNIYLFTPWLVGILYEFCIASTIHYSMLNCSASVGCLKLSINLLENASECLINISCLEADKNCEKEAHLLAFAIMNVISKHAIFKDFNKVDTTLPP